MGVLDAVAHVLDPSQPQQQDQGWGGLLKAAGSAAGQVGASLNPFNAFRSAESAVSGTDDSGFRLTPAERATALAGIGLGVAGGAGIRAFHNYRAGMLHQFWKSDEGSFSLWPQPGAIRVPKGTPYDTPFRAATIMRATTPAEAATAISRIPAGSMAPEEVAAHRQYINGFFDSYSRRIVEDHPDHQAGSQSYSLPTAAHLPAGQLEWAKFDAAVNDGKFKSDKPIISDYQKMISGQRLSEQRATRLADFMHQFALDTSWMPHPAVLGGSPTMTLRGITRDPDTNRFNFDWKKWEAPEDPTDPKQREAAIRSLNPVGLLPQGIENIRTMLSMAKPEHWLRGAGWYPDARDDIHARAQAAGLDPAKAAAGVSLLSAGQTWTDNVDKLFSTVGNNDNQFGGMVREGNPAFAGQFVSQPDLDRLGRLDNESPEQILMQPGADQGRWKYAWYRALKQPSFYLNLEHPELWLPTTIDRHAFDLFMGHDTGISKRPLDQKDWYTTIAQAYRQVASENRLLPQELQAIVWEAWKDFKEQAGGKKAGWHRPVGPATINPYVVNLLRGAGDDSLDSFLQSFPADRTPQAPGASGFVHTPEGPTLVSPPDPRLRTEVRLLAPGGGGNGNDDPVPWLPVVPRVVYHVGDVQRELRQQLGLSLGSTAPAVFRTSADPSAVLHDAMVPGTAVNVRSKDPGVLDAIEARLRDVERHDVSGVQRSVWTQSTHRKVEPITEGDISTVGQGRSRAVSHDEFQRLADVGRQQLAGRAARSAPAAGLDNNWESIKNSAWAEVQKSWGGATIDAHTGVALESDADKYALTVRPPGVQPVSVPENATRAQFNAAMDRAKEHFRATLEMEGGHLGVFHDDDEHRIDIDPVIVTGNKDDIDTMGSYTHAVGGAYHFASGDGFWPPHVEGPAPEAQTETQHSMTIPLDNPRKAKAVLHAAKEVADQAGVPVQRTLYTHGQPQIPGMTQIAEHLFDSPTGPMVFRTQYGQVADPHAAPAWVPDDEAAKLPERYPQGPRLIQPTGGSLGDAVVDHGVRVAWTHMPHKADAPDPTFAKDLVRESRIYGARPKAFAMYIPLHPSQGGTAVEMPALTFGTDAENALQGMMGRFTGDATRVVVGQVSGGKVMLHIPGLPTAPQQGNLMLELQARQLLHRLGITLSPSNVVATYPESEPA